MIPPEGIVFIAMCNCYRENAEGQLEKCGYKGTQQTDDGFLFCLRCANELLNLYNTIWVPTEPKSYDHQKQVFMRMVEEISKEKS
jgi:hypothetical protein